MLKQLILAILLGGSLWGAGPEAIGPQPAAAQAPCLPAAEARAAVQSGEVVPLSQMRAQIAKEAGGEVVSAQLCRSGESFVYVVNILSMSGEVKQLTVEAGRGRVGN